MYDIKNVYVRQNDDKNLSKYFKPEFLNISWRLKR